MLGVVIGATILLLGLLFVISVGVSVTSKSIEYFKEKF